MPFSFKRGVYIDSAKGATIDKPIELLPAPRFVTLPVTMHSGPPNDPAVSIGERVMLGTKISDSASPAATPVHATVAGRVADIAPLLYPDGGQALSVVIENDNSDRLDPSVVPIDADTLRPDEIIRRVRESGIVGHRGAPVPAHVKLSAALGRVENIIINASECEPYVTSDYRIMLEYPWEATGGAQIIHRLVGAARTIFAVGSDKKNAAASLNEYLPRDGSMAVEAVSAKHPQGSEKQLVRALFGIEIPLGKSPVDVGVLVINIDTAAAIFRLFTTGMPMVRRIVTVAGGAVANPKNLEVRIGTPIEELLAACGGTKGRPRRLVMGGPMIGSALEAVSAPVIKSTYAVLALDSGECHQAKSYACIRCGKCIEVCPMGLMPLYLYAAAARGSPEDLKRYGVSGCIECGSCAYVCPGSVPIVGAIREGKARADAHRAQII